MKDESLRGCEIEETSDLSAVNAVFVARRHREWLGFRDDILERQTNIRHTLRLPQA